MKHNYKVQYIIWGTGFAIVEAESEMDAGDLFNKNSKKYIEEEKEEIYKIANIIGGV